LPASPLWPIVIDATDRTVAAWNKLGQKDLLPKNIAKVIDHQITTVAKSVRKAVIK
jgi:hypothetical protein